MSFAPDNGDGGASTSWHAYDVPAMWALVGDFDTDPQWTHVAAWQKTADLTSLHLSHMRAYRDQLAAAWPPDKNEASRVYVGYLDKLIASVQSTYDAAIANHDTMAGATSAIVMAKAKLRPLYDKWRTNAALMAEYDGQVAFAQESQVPVPMSGPPPLPLGWRDDLNRQARQLMSGLSGELSLATVKVVMPPVYNAPLVRRQGQRPIDDGSRPVLVPPVIPSVQPRSAAVSTPASTQTVGPGPSLAEGTFAPGLLVITAPSPVMPGSSQSALPPVEPTVIGLVPGQGVPGVPAGSVRPGGPGTIGSMSPLANIKSPAPPTTASPMGGVIGGSLKSGVQAIGRSPLQRVNPVGGVIGDQGAVVGSTAVRSSGTLVAGRRLAHNVHGGSTQPWDPDNPWKTETGVSPVVEPDLEPTDHYPGPSIGLNH